VRLLLALLAIAIVAQAHWTHDDSLAREIGAPPGEDDIDVGSLSDELISTSVQNVPQRTYRVTVGTRATGAASHTVGATVHAYLMSLKGDGGTAWVPGATHDDAGGQEPRYYMGPMMGYDQALIQAPPLRFGSTPVIMPGGSACTLPDSSDKSKNNFCDSATGSQQGTGGTNEALADQSVCEPNNKECQNAFENDGAGGSGGKGMGYIHGATQKLCNTPACQGSDQMFTGPIQRGQVKFEDVGQITAVQFIEKKDTHRTRCETELTGAGNSQDTAEFSCSSPWSPAFIKVSTNNPQTGIGNGIFYIKPRSDLTVGTLMISSAGAVSKKVVKLEARPAAPTDSGLPADESFNAVLSKCTAQTCEEEMDTALGLTQMRTEFGEVYASDAEF
jgi:hypothetical protein